MGMSTTGGGSLRLLGAIRRSKRTTNEDPTTAPARQEADIRREAEWHRAEIAGWARDLGVSAGDVAPWERPSLGPWLNERLGEYDGIVWSRYDRAIRNMRDMHKLSEWAVTHRKMIIFVVGPHSGQPMRLDFRNGPLDPVTSLMLTLFAFAAEMEWRAIKERAQDTAAYMRQAGRWGGGRHPYHLMPVKIGKEWRLIHNPETAPIVRAAIKAILEDGKNCSRIAEELTEKGIPTPLDYIAMTKDRIPVSPFTGKVHAIVDRDIVIRATGEGTRTEKVSIPGRRAVIAVKEGDVVREGQRLTVHPGWSNNALIDILRSPSLLGQSEYEGKPVLDHEGKPVKRAEPLIDRDTFKQLQKALDSHVRGGGGRRPKNASEFLNIGFCIRCGHALYQAHNNVTRNGTTWRYYTLRCSFASGKAYRYVKDRPEVGCNAGSVPGDDLVEITRSTLLSLIGDLEIMEERVIPGQNHRDEIEQAQEALGHFLSEVTDKGPAVAAVYQAQINALTDLINRLSAEPVTDDRIEWVPTGVTYRSLWQDARGDRLYKLLSDTGVRIEAGPTKDSVVSLGRFERPERYDQAIIMGVDGKIAYAIYVPKDLADRVAGQAPQLQLV